MLFCALTATAQDQFKPNGNPFHHFGTATDFDSTCPTVEGSAKPDSGGAAQNEVKNNFAAKGAVKEITIKDLAFLETEIAKNKDYESWSGLHPPKNRKPFNLKGSDLKEGRLVQITAYIYEAHTADVTGGESVNCGIGTSKKAKHKVKRPEAIESNDIHIALVETKEQTADEDAECESVTAEVIPHFRPAAWDEKLFKSTLQGRLVRLTGQLMYDSAHKPCNEDEEASPARQSSWEIHPIYKVEKCTEDDGSGKCTGEWEEIQ